ncbi:MAG: hypothetical protein J6I68_15270 [Butyrivibrio sp.]|uniref:hypothetical protein n=1 Tax=Butyrivibrio sp. TaxID=28121 RepID=UPI001B711549|nr:hypothetical protein [Butyrivibrio sp.]MBP3784605.1 hypothetical protein [Butyrivibrio sp.]
MKQFNVEIFDNNFAFLFNTSTGDIKYKEDYLDPEKSKVALNTTTPIQANYFIRLYRDKEDYSGIVTEAKKKDDGTTDVTFTSIENMFDREVLIDVAEITGTAEEYLKARIDELYVTNTDLSQRFSLTVTAETSTQSWDFDYKIENEPDEGEEPPVRQVAFINILDDLILPMFTKYGIILYWKIDFNAKTVHVTITKNTDPVMNIEADLPNIIDKTVTIRKSKKQINKVNIWNSKDFERSTVYYLHPDDSFDTSDSDRVTPVNYKNQKVSTNDNAKCIDNKVKELKSDYSKIKSYNSIDPEERTEEDIEEALEHMSDINSFMAFGWTYNDSDSLIYDADGIIVGQETWEESDEFELSIEGWADSEAAATYGETTALALFTEKAYDKALSTFSKNKYDNLIELEVAIDDSLLTPATLRIGQIVNVIYEGNSYNTILTGREVDDTITLIFGTIRLEFTKYLKGRA